MELLIAGLAGVAVGAILATGILLKVLQKRADRDLVERRLRVCAEYLDALGDLERAVHGAAADPVVLEQAWLNARSFCREFRLTGWILRPEARATLQAIVAEIDRYGNGRGGNGSDPGGRAAQVLCEVYHQVRRVVRSEMDAEERAFRAFRFFPDLRLRRRGEPS